MIFLFCSASLNLAAQKKGLLSLNALQGAWKCVYLPPPGTIEIHPNQNLDEYREETELVKLPPLKKKPGTFYHDYYTLLFKGDSMITMNYPCELLRMDSVYVKGDSLFMISEDGYSQSECYRIDGNRLVFHAEEKEKEIRFVKTTIDQEFLNTLLTVGTYQKCLKGKWLYGFGGSPKEYHEFQVGEWHPYKPLDQLTITTANLVKDKPNQLVITVNGKRWYYEWKMSHGNFENGDFSRYLELKILNWEAEDPVYLIYRPDF